MARRKRRITVEDLFRIRVPQTADISPDGESIVYSVKNINEKKNRYTHQLFRVPFKGGQSRPLTSGKANDTQPVWSPNGRKIAFFSER